ncbi:hypothetical protein [uncultured Treponema sp.]|uniref:hypothetical protein n=1 Tax=uncultured Treponema sp. TaxID=162155 RepID=UPI0025EF4CBE|nr:hypothetical protein [uncultured Treponema sp.]
MKKRSLVIAILFCIFSHIYADNEWVEIASTENKNLTYSDIVRFFVTELGKGTYHYAVINYETFDGENWHWTYCVNYRKNRKVLRLFIRNARIDVALYSEPDWYVTTNDGRRIDSVNINSYAFSNMAYSTILSCIIESKLLLKKHGQVYSGTELEGIEELEGYADLLKLNTLR